MSLSQNELTHVCKLAHLHIDEDEKAGYLSDMKHTLELMKSLDEFDLTDKPASTYAHDHTHYLRSDTVSKTEDYLLDTNAPAWEKGCFKVPKILGGGD